MVPVASPQLRKGCAFLTLESLYIRELGELFTGGRARTWEEVAEGVEFPTALTQFYFYRLRHSLRALLGEDKLEPLELPALTILTSSNTKVKLVSRLYTSAQESSHTAYTKARLDWQAELGTPITDEI